MSKERTEAFTDAVLAIIMTILVLELEKPNPVSMQGFFELRENFFSYALSFFWIGMVWVTLHNNWMGVEKINNLTVWVTLILLFFLSFFPYSTSIVAKNFYNKSAQVFYGAIILLVTFTMVALSLTVGRENPKLKFGLLYKTPDTVTFVDIAIKIAGMILAATIYPPAMVYAILFDMVLLLVTGAFRSRFSNEKGRV